MHTWIRLAAWAAILAGLVMIFVLNKATFMAGVILTLVGVGVLCWSNSVRYRKEDEAKRESFEQRQARVVVEAEQTLKRAQPVINRLKQPTTSGTNTASFAGSTRNTDYDNYAERRRREQDEQFLQMSFTNAALLDVITHDNNSTFSAPTPDDDSCRYNQSDNSSSYDSSSSNDSCSYDSGSSSDSSSSFSSD